MDGYEVATEVRESMAKNAAAQKDKRLDNYGRHVVALVQCGLNLLNSCIGELKATRAIVVSSAKFYLVTVNLYEIDVRVPKREL